jgi:hypothetical protein
VTLIEKVVATTTPMGTVFFVVNAKEFIDNDACMPDVNPKMQSHFKKRKQLDSSKSESH